MSDNTGKKKCLPVYLVVDTSGSMEKHTELLNQTVKRVVTHVADSPKVAEFAHISIITFNTLPHVVLEMTSIDDLTRLPKLACTAKTNYGAMFAQVRQSIEADVPKLIATGRGVLRPVVFILTDGVPSDNDWAAQFNALVDKSWRHHPHTVSFGFGNAVEPVLARIGTLRAFKAAVDDKVAITNMLNTLLHTLVQSAGADGLRVPRQVPGFDTIPDDYMMDE
ncbi:VWA domain-containing protein [Actinoplanes sp. TFC3]|uniref:vWA domain-containing protein n=1 Tax=Actinoplanes sp. TFC3 TaxID=1710355 RepID=UPI00082B54F9|nr:VWA domain-containing protein [Actinoplanes sp. TFC3]